MLDNKNLQNKLNVLDSKKQPKVTVGKSVPSKRLGNNGSMHIGLMADGVKLFVKYNGEWHQTSLDRLSNINQKNKGLTNKFINTLLLRFFDADTSHYAGLKAHSTTTTSQDYVLPAAPPASDKVLQSDSSGNLTWESLPVPDSIADDNMLGNISGSTGVATALTASQVRTLINVENGATADQTQGDINGLAITTTGALNGGSITSGFGNIDVGSSTIDTTGNVSVGDLQVNGNDINFDAASSNIAIDASAHDTVGKNLAILAGNTTAGTTDDIAGGHISLYAGRGKGSGSGGSIKLYVADGGSSGSSLNAYATAMTIDDDLKLTAKGDVEVDGGDLYVKGASGYVAEMFIIADDGEDNADEWKISAADAAGSNIFSFSNKISGSHVNHFYINPNATVASSSATLAGSLAVNGTNGITAGAVIWQSFPFIASSITASRGFYFRDNDDPEDFRKWDEFDADMVLVYGRIYGHYVVPEDCTLKHMRGIVANDGSTDDVIINVWYCLQTNIQTDTTSTTFTKAGSDTDVTIGTSEVGVQFNEDYDVDLTAGSIVIPTIKNGGAGFDSFLGSLTLKFITR